MLSAWAASPRLESLPGPVRDRIVETVAGGRLLEVAATNDNGHVVYEAEMRGDGVDRAFTVGEDGSLLARQVFLTELPAPVRLAILAQTDGARSREIYWINDEGEPCYYLEFFRADKKRALTIAPDGWVISRELLGQEIPTPVAAAIQKNLAGRTPAEVDLADDGTGTTCEVLEIIHGREQVWIFQTNGVLAAAPVEMNAIPAAARGALADRATGGRITHWFQYEEDGVVLYEVAWVRQSRRYVVTVDATGKVVSEELPIATLPVPLAQAIQKQAAGRYLVRIEKHLEPDGFHFDATFRQKGGTEVVGFSQAGEIIQRSARSPAKN
jgi:uncharacterized membrane protein YkoI